MPASSPLAWMSVRTVFSTASHRSVISIPGFATERTYLRTYVTIVSEILDVHYV